MTPGLRSLCLRWLRFSALLRMSSTLCEDRPSLPSSSPRLSLENSLRASSLLKVPLASMSSTEFTPRDLADESGTVTSLQIILCPTFLIEVWLLRPPVGRQYQYFTGYHISPALENQKHKHVKVFFLLVEIKYTTGVLWFEHINASKYKHRGDIC